MPASPTYDVLVVDESPSTLEFVREALESAGLRVTCERHAERALQRVRHYRPALVLVSPQAQLEGGESLAARLSQFERGARPIVILYAAGGADALSTLRSSTGSDGYVPKGTSMDELGKRLKAWLPSPPARRSQRVVRARFYGSPSQLPLDLDEPFSSGDYRRTRVFFADRDPVALRMYRELEALGTFKASYSEGEGDPALLRHIFSATPPDVIVWDPIVADSSAGELLEKAVRLNRSWKRRFVLATREPVGHLTPYLSSVTDQVLYKPFEAAALRRCLRFAALAARALSAPDPFAPTGSG